MRVYRFGEFELAANERLLLRNGRPQSLTPKSFDLLVALVEDAGRLVGKDELISRVWPESFIEENSLNRNIYLLRKALGDGAKYIETVPKHGYRFMAEVAQVPDGDTLFIVEKHTEAEIVTEEVTDSRTIELDAAIAPPSPVSRLRRYALPMTATACLLMITAIVYLLTTGNLGRGATPSAVKSIAVMPFKNLTGDPALDYFSDGLTERFINELSRINELKVISHTSAFAFKEKDIDAQRIRKALGVETVLEGSVHKSGDKVVVEARLVSCYDGQIIWTSGFHQRPLTDIFAVQNEIACSVTSKLRLDVCSGNRRSTRHLTNNVDAYQDYLKGQYHLNKRTKESIQKAMEHFQKAIEVDPNFAIAYAGLADCYNQSLWYTSNPPPELIANGKAMARRALEIDDTIGEAHAVLSALTDLEWNWNEAVKEGELAIHFSPGSARVHHIHAFVVAKGGRLDEAIAQIRLAQELDPLNLVIASDLAEILAWAGRYDEAIEESLKTIGLDPNFSMAYVSLAHAYWGKGMFEESITPLQKAAELDDRNPSVMYRLAISYAFAGHPDEAREFLSQLKERSKREYVDPNWLAGLYAALGEKDNALDVIEKAVNERSVHARSPQFNLAYLILRSEPRFQALLRRVQGAS